jgi:hypothetical protein
MANILYPPPAPQSVGEILDSAFRIFTATVVKCLAYSTIAVLAGQLPSFYNLANRRPLLEEVNDPIWWLLYVVGTLIAAALAGAILLRQYALATGHPVSLGGELGTGVRRLGAVVLLGILFALGVGLSLLPLGVAFVFEGWLRLALATLLALPACGVVLAFSSAWAILLVTGKSAFDSLIHSARLTWGSWWRLTLIYTVGLVLLMVLYALSGMIAAVAALLVARGDIAVITAVTAVVVLILSAIGTPFYSALMLAVLGDLSVRREGADLEQRLGAPTAR